MAKTRPDTTPANLPVAEGVEVSGVGKRYGEAGGRIEVLAGIDLKIESGQNLAITGPSGSGKSTLLHILGTLDTPSTGTVTIDGADPFALPERALARFRNQRLGFVFQDHYLLPQYSVLDNVLLPTLAAGRQRAAAVREQALSRARELLYRVGLGERMEHTPGQLSGGERQRVAVARALINEPDLVLCDEPTGNLDPETAEEVAELLFGLHLEGGNILVVVTHSMELAGRCQRRFELRNGHCIEV